MICSCLYCGFFRFPPIWWWWWLGSGGFFLKSDFCLILRYLHLMGPIGLICSPLLILRTGFCLLQFKFSGNASILLTSFTSIFNSLFFAQSILYFHYSSRPHFEESENFFYSCGDWEYLLWVASRISICRTVHGCDFPLSFRCLFEPRSLFPEHKGGNCCQIFPVFFFFS